MTPTDLRALQAPLKQRYRERPEAALVTLEAAGTLDAQAFACRVATHGGAVEAGLHPATGGSGEQACSGDMLLQALLACAGVTLTAVAATLGIAIRSGSVAAAGELDFRGTLGVDREAPVGFRRIRIRFTLDTDAADDALANLLRLTERYCVVLQTLRVPAAFVATIERGGAGI